MFDVTETGIPGCLEIALPRFPDARGAFVKTLQRTPMAQRGLPIDWVEQFTSRSRRGVVRGLHLQEPPAALAKLVTCVFGTAWDVTVDLRRGSPTYGQHAVVVLSEERGNAVLAPEGCAHGFLAQADDTILSYWTTAEYAPASDTGVRWDSAGIDWPLEGEPLVSERDLALPALADYDSPFVFEG